MEESAATAKAAQHPKRRHFGEVPREHWVNGNPLMPPYCERLRGVLLAGGNFWFLERHFWNCPGVYVTAVGYAGGSQPWPNFAEVCAGHSGHREVVRIIYEPERLPCPALLECFWRYLSSPLGLRFFAATEQPGAIFYADDPIQETQAWSRLNQHRDLPSDRFSIQPAPTFYYAEALHQQYLAKYPNTCDDVGH